MTVQQPRLFDATPEARARAAHRETAAERAAVVTAIGEQGWQQLLVRRRAARLARARRPGRAGDLPRQR